MICFLYWGKFKSIIKKIKKIPRTCLLLIFKPFNAPLLYLCQGYACQKIEDTIYRWVGTLLCQKSNDWPKIMSEKWQVRFIKKNFVLNILSYIISKTQHNNFSNNKIANIITKYTRYSLISVLSIIFFRLRPLPSTFVY